MDAYILLFALLWSVLALATFIPYSAGALNLGVAGSYAIGGFVAALISTRYLSSNSVLLQLAAATPIAILIAAGVAFALWRITARLKGIYFALATLSFLEFFRVVCLNLDYLGGAIGVFGIAPIAENEALVAVIAGCWALVALGICTALNRSIVGRCFHVVRLDEYVAQSVGLNISFHKLQAALLSSTLASVTGVFAAHALGTWNSRQGTFDTAVLLVACAVLGGTRHPIGTFLAGVLLSIVPEYLRDFGDWRLIASSAVLVLGCLYFPNGISGFAQPKVIPQRQNFSKQAVFKPSAKFQTAHEVPEFSTVSVLQLCNISVAFGGVQALKDVSFEIRADKIFGLIGPNGAGKTTLMNVVSGFVPVRKGQIFLDDLELTRMQGFERARQGLARTFQNIRLIDELSVLENVRVGCLFESSNQSRFNLSHSHTLSQRKMSSKEISIASYERAIAMLHWLGLSSVESSQAGKLSYGLKRKVELARALMMNPKFLILDEPAAGLNSSEKGALADLLLMLSANRVINLGQNFPGKTRPGLILIEHDMPLVQKVCAEIVVLQNGGVIAQGETLATMQSEKVREAYLGKADV